MTPDQIWGTYIRPMGAGAVAAAGLITLLRTLPTIFSALKAGLKDVRAEGAGQSARRRAASIATCRCAGSSSAPVLIIVMMWILLTFHPIPGAETRWYHNLFAGIFVTVFGFLFVTVAARISGLLGNSSNPISGMSIATLMATCAIFFVAGWTAPNYQVLALMIGGVVCIAAAIAGATSQDLKTGYLVGATPFWQQMGLLIGVTVSTLAIGTTLNLMNKGLEKYIPTQIPVNVAVAPHRRKSRARHLHLSRQELHAHQFARLARNSRRRISVQPRHQTNRVSVGPRHRQRQSSRSAGAPDGHGHQRHPQSTPAVASGVDGRRAGHRRRNSRRALAGFRHRLLSSARAPPPRCLPAA